MSDGIELQRFNYLTQCVTESEVNIVQKMWQKIRKNELKLIISIVVKTGVKVKKNIYIYLILINILKYF